MAMNRHTQPHHKPTLIIGMGATGRSVAAWLSRQALPFVMSDSRSELDVSDELMQLYPESELILGDLSRIDPVDYSSLIVSPGVAPTMAVVASARQAGISVVGDIELFAQAVEQPVIAVTGSNGKSTVVHLLTQMYADAGTNVALGGNFGIPALELLDDSAVEQYVLELSSFQLETTDTLALDVATVLNISEDHMDRYADLSAYVEAKGRIFEHCKIAVVNRDDVHSLALAADCEMQISFGLDQPEENQFGILHKQQTSWLAKGSEALLETSELKIFGRHNQANALAALALAEAGGLPLSDAVNTLRGYTGLPHRTQWVAEVQGVTWLNDSKATNVGATVAALGGLDRPVVLIAGGQGKSADFSALRDAVHEHVKAVVLVGEDAEILFRALKGAAAISMATDMSDAVAQAAKLAVKGDYVLLSPACASFDQYSGYAERGDSFIRCVEALGGQG